MDSKTTQDIPKPRLRCVDRQDTVLRLMKIDDLIDDEHLARTVWAFVETMDFTTLYAQVKAIEGKPGSPAIDFKILTAILLYAKLDGEISARRIADYCKAYNPYIWLCGGVNINHHSLSDFETGHAEWLEEQFVSHLTSMMTQGFVHMERVAQDGMRVRANAGAASFRRKETLEECLEQAQAYQAQLQRERQDDVQVQNKRKQAAQERAARERIERIQAAIAQVPEVEAKKKEKDRKKARVSTTDPDARVMKMADGGYRSALNAQFASDPSSQIIIGFDVINEGSDQNQLSPMLEQIHEHTGQYPDEALVDGGFINKKEVEHCATKGITVYGPVSKPKDESRDPHQPLAGDSQAVADWRKRMGTDEAKEIYKYRAATAECVNAIARNRGLRQFTVRGLKKVKASLLWFVFAHNLMREAVLRPVAA